MKRIVAELLLILLWIGLVPFSFRIQPVKAWTDGGVNITRDGSVDPPYAPMTRNGNTYTLTDDIISIDWWGIGIYLEGDIVIDGAGHTIQYSGSSAYSYGIYNNRGLPLNVTVKNLTIKGFSKGLWVPPGLDSDTQRICANQVTITNCTEGFYLEGASDCNITGNNITACSNGIFLYYSTHNNIIGNRIAGSTQAAVRLVSSSHNNTISGNSISDNSYSFWFDYSWDNKVYHNVFKNNSQPAYITPLGIEESWDDGYPSGGNYWSDYQSKYPNATEMNHTGMWNTPYVVDPNNRDDFPFMYELYQPRQGPTASFTCSQATAKVDQLLVFNASACLPGSNGTYPMPITEYYWDFGDSNTTSTDQPVILHSFTYSNVFNVTLTVTDSEDLTSSCSNIVTVVMPTALSVMTNSTSTVLSYIVNVYGNLSDAHGNCMANETVMLYYTFSGSSTWYPISSGSTDAYGQYYVQWMPSATGYFTIEADWAGNATHLASNDTVSLSVLPYQNTYAFSVESNSTVSGLTFDTNSQTLSFSVSGESGTEGYARVTIAKALVPDITKLQVQLDGVNYSYFAVSLDDSWLLTFTYSHSAHRVEVYLVTNAVPEFPSILILPLFLIATLLAVIIYRRRKVRCEPEISRTP